MLRDELLPPNFSYLHSVVRRKRFIHKLSRRRIHRKRFLNHISRARSATIVSNISPKRILNISTMPSQTPCISLGYVDSRSRAISRMKPNKQTAEQTFLIHFYRSRRKERVGNRLGTGDWRGSMNNSYDCVNCRQRIFSFTCEAHTTALAFVSKVMGIIIFYEKFSRFLVGCGGEI